MVLLNILHLFSIANVITGVAAFSPAAITSPPTVGISPSSPCRHHGAVRSTSTLATSITSSSRRRRATSPTTTTVGRSGHASPTRLQATSSSYNNNNDRDNNPFLARRERFLFELQTLVRVLLPALLAGIAAYVALPAMCVRVAIFVTRVTEPAKIGMLTEVVSSAIGLVGLLYSILMGQVFGFLYSQQEALYYALFDEVTEAKSLLEQVALVSQGRTMYSTCLNSIARYVKDDLLAGTLSYLKTDSNPSNKSDTKYGSVTPSLILSARPADDPLEAILYLTSVGIPGQVYDTVRSLRQARARRLGALQRKVPGIHLIMLWILGAIMMMSFPVLVGVGGAAAAGGLPYAQAFPGRGYNVATLQGGLFGVATFAVVMTSNMLGELWKTKGGAYNVDAVLRVMVRGLQRELEERMVEAKKIMKRSKNNE